MKKEKEIPRVEDLELVLVDRGLHCERLVWSTKKFFMPHHPTQPAVQYTNGDWAWLWMGKQHRLDGPALFWNGEIRYWIHGQKLTREEWERHPLRMEWLMTNKLGGI